MSGPDRSFVKGIMLHAFILGLLASFVPEAMAAQDAGTTRREKALSDLQIGDAAVRASACAVLAETGYVVAIDGRQLKLQHDTLCIHGDTYGAVSIAAEICRDFAERGIGIRAAY